MSSHRSIRISIQQLRTGFDLTFLPHDPIEAGRSATARRDGPLLKSLGVYRRGTYLGNVCYDDQDWNDPKLPGLNLVGIEACTGLEHLVVHVPVKSFNGIEFCSELQRVRFMTSIYRSFDLMGELRYLTMIDFTDCYFSKEFTDSTMLTGLKNLKELEMTSCTGIKNLELIRGLSLRKLICVESNLESIKGIGLDEMKFLNIRGNRIRRITRLRRAKKLEHLIICANRIKSLEPINHILDSGQYVNYHGYQDPESGTASGYPDCEYKCTHTYNPEEDG